MFPSRRARWVPRSAALLIAFAFFHSGAHGQIRDGGIDPWNLGKGDWIYFMSAATNKLGGNVASVTNENSLMLFYKSQGIRYFIVKAATSDQLFNGSYAFPQFTSALVNTAHANGLLIFGYNRSYGSNVVGEIAISDYVFNQGADGFVWDAEAEWESGNSWITNGSLQAWQLCSTVRSNWPNKFLAHAPFPIISFHNTFPYREFGYWSDTVMPQIYPANWTGVHSRPSGGINWTDVNWFNWQNSLVGSNSLMNGVMIYWTNAIKPLAPVNHVYGPNPPNSGVSEIPPEFVMEFVDYLNADPNPQTVGGYKGANYWRTDLHGAGQWANIKASTIGSFTGIVNNIVIDNPNATRVGSWTSTRTFYNGSFFGNGGGTDTNSFGTNYLTKTQGAGSAYIQFTPNIVVPGAYDVFQWHPNLANASTNAPHLVNYSGGSTTIGANQITNAGKWSLLGRFNFAAGTNGNIRVLDTIAEPASVAIADGMKFVFASTNLVPAAPTGLSASAVSTSQINLAWTDNATDETGCQVARSTSSGGPYTTIASLPANATAYTNTGLSSSTTYYYVVRATNSVGPSPNSIEAGATTFTSATPPTIILQPQSQTANPGDSVLLKTAASGSPPFSYQWSFNGTNLPGATHSSLALGNVTTNQSGPYTAVVTNSYGATTSQVATLSVNPAFQVGGVTPLWSLAPGSRPYLTTNSLPFERGLAYDSLTRHLLLVSRSGPHVYVLDADSSADISELNVSTVTGGTYPLLLIGVADDGVVYAGNLTTAGATTAFKLYRWANDNSNTVPTVAFSGDPSPGNSQRWGDTLDVRGAGAGTQIILGSRSSTNAAILTTTDGTNFTATSITVADAPAGGFGLGIAFGTNNSFWGKATGQALRQVTYNLAGGSGSSTRVYADPAFPNTVAPIGVSTALNLLGGINVGSANNHFRLYDLTTNNGTPVLIATNGFPTDNENSGTGTGSVDFGPDRVYALGANNGIIALQLNPVATPPAISLQPQNQTVTAGQNATFSVTATGTAPLNYQWRFFGTNLAGATSSSLTRISAQPNDAGPYTVVVTNVAGSVTSSVATLTVNLPPSITNQPQSQIVFVGSNAVFSVGAAGTGPLSYQWRYNGTNIPGATASSYTMNSAQLSDAGDYSAVVTNIAGNAASSNATLTVLPVNVPPAITQQPQSQATNQGADVTFTVAATGTPPPAYQWSLNGTNIAGATGTAYTRANVQPADAGNYSVLVSNIAGSIPSSNAVLTVLQPVPPHIDSITVLPGGQIQLLISGDPGHYGIDGSSNLFDWTELTNLTATNSPFDYLDSETGLLQRFYRARRLP